MSSTILKLKTLCVITGASKGYGKSMVEKFASLLPNGSKFIILARSIDKLETLSKNILTKHPNITVHPFKLDQGILSECSVENIQKMVNMAKINAADFEQALIIHNAGTLGDVTKFVTQMTDAKMVEEAMNVNITGTVLLNASLLSIFQEVKKKVVINISSLAAIQAFPSWSIYCTGKTARNMFFKSLAVEDKTIRVLNWAPGPLDTEMQVLCRTSADDTVRKTFQDMHIDGKLLSCEASVDKLVMVLEKNNFESGAHIDYYDV